MLDVYYAVCLQEFSANPGRRWLDSLLQSRDDDKPTMSSTSRRRFVDVFRWLHPTMLEAYTNWCTVTGARATNYGCRLDYIIADIGLVPYLVSCDIMDEVEGSDHCPVRAKFDICVTAARKCPPLCTKYLPQFAGRQQTLATFFGKRGVKRHKPMWQDGHLSIDEHRSQFSSSSSEQLSQDQMASNILRSPSDTAEFCVDGTQSVTRCAETELTDALSNDDSSSAVVAKQLKLSDNKQSSLLTFFSKHLPTNSACEEPVTPVSQSVASNSTDCVWLPVAVDHQHCDTLPQGLLGSGSKLRDANTASKWKTLLKGPPRPPLCNGHKEPCALRTVKKDGPNKGKQFWVCCKPDGPKNNPEARCDYFVWVSSKK